MNTNLDVAKVWDLFRLILLICMFFWFGWKVGLLCIVLGTQISND